MFAEMINPVSAQSEMIPPMDQNQVEVERAESQKKVFIKEDSKMAGDFSARVGATSRVGTVSPRQSIEGRSILKSSQGVRQSLDNPGVSFDPAVSEQGDLSQ